MLPSTRRRKLSTQSAIPAFPDVFTTRVNSYNAAVIQVMFKPEYENTLFPVTLKSQVMSMAMNFGGANWRVSGIDESYFNNNVVSYFKNSGILLRGYNYDELLRYAEILVGQMSGNRRISGLEIRKVNQSYEVRVVYGFIGSAKLQKKTEEDIVRWMNSEVLPVGFKAVETEYRWADRHKGSYIWLILLIMAVIYIIISVTFESFRLPLPVMFMIPVSFIGMFLVFGLSDGPKEVFWFDFAIGTIAGMLFSVIALFLVLPVFVVHKDSSSPRL